MNLSGREFNPIHSGDITLFEEVNEVVQEDRTDSLNPEMLGLLASIGIEKGKPFALNDRMKKF